MRYVAEMEGEEEEMHAPPDGLWELLVDVSSDIAFRCVRLGRAVLG